MQPSPSDTYREEKIPVPQAFAAVFSHFYYGENNSAVQITKTLLPTYETIMVFVYGQGGFVHDDKKEKLQIQKCILLGPIKKAFTYTLLAHTQILVVSFKEDAFFRFFGSVFFTSNRWPLDPDLLVNDNCFTALWEKLAGIPMPVNKIGALLSFCEPYLQTRTMIAEALFAVKDSSLNPIKATAASTRQTDRNIQLHHKKYLGYSAGQRARYQRFLEAIRIIQTWSSKATKEKWFDVIDQCGYYDQSQLIHDFQYYLHMSPTRYLKLQQHFCSPDH